MCVKKVIKIIDITLEELKRIKRLAENKFPYEFNDDFEKNFITIEKDNKIYHLRKISDVLKNIKDLYYISDKGYIYSLYKDDFITSHDDSKRGYLKVKLRTVDNNHKSFSVHRLVMIVYNYRDDFEDYDVNHIDTNKKNNHIDNLEWCTNKENWRHSIREGIRDDYGDYIKDLSTVHKICEEREKGERPKHISDKLNVSYDAVKKICTGDNYTEIVSQYEFNEMHKFRSLNLDQIESVMNDIKKGIYSQKEIADKHNTSRGVIRRVRNTYVK